MPLLKIHTESVDHFFIVRLGFGPDVKGVWKGPKKDQKLPKSGQKGPSPTVIYATTPADRKVKSQTTDFISHSKNAMC